MRTFNRFLKEELLLEYDADVTWKAHGKKVLDRAAYDHEEGNDDHPIIKHAVASGPSRSDVHTSEEEASAHFKPHIMQHLEAGDPTDNKKYVPHIARMYGSKGINRLEDVHARMKPALARYDELSRKKKLAPEDRDIGRVKSLNHLEDIVDKHAEADTSSNDEKKAHSAKMRSEATITDHPDFTHIVPHTTEAAAHFGKGTKWCTATAKSEDSMFDHYNLDGPLQIYQPKKPAYPGEKYQYHYSSGQLMDPEDNNGHKKVKDNHPAIHDHIQNYKNEADSVSGTVEGIDHPESSVRHDSIKKAKLNDAHVDKIIANGDSLTLAKNPNLTSKHLHKILDSDQMNGKIRAIDHPNADQSHFDRVMNGNTGLDKNEVTHYHTELENAAVEKTNNPDHLDKVWNRDDADETRSSVMRNPLAYKHGYFEKAKALQFSMKPLETAAKHTPNPDHIDELLDHPQIYANGVKNRIARAAAANPNATEAHLDKAMKNKLGDVVARHPKATTQHLNDIMNDAQFTKGDALVHPNIADHHLDNVILHRHSYGGDSHDISWLKINALDNPKVSDNHIWAALHDEDKDVRTHAATKAKHPEHIEKALSDDMYVAGNIAYNPHATHEHLTKLMNRTDADGDVKDEIRRHANYREPIKEARVMSFKTMLVLESKAAKANIPVVVLEEVYNRGIATWNEDTLKTPQQYAFNRVNSYISGGLASKLDKDLSFDLDISGTELKEGRRITNNVEYHVVDRNTKSVVKKYTQKHKAMYHAKRTKLTIHTVQNARIVHRQDHMGRKLDANGYIIEGDEYIAARQKLHDAHSEISRQLAGRERDPELRRNDLHRSKKHAHASRILEMLKTKKQ